MDFINKIFAVRHQTLEHCKHVTGIETGDDEKFLLDKPTAGSEPVITGKHIESYRITGEKYINYEEAHAPGWNSNKLNEREEPVIFVLWGSFARSKKELITNNRHKIIESVHPSPLSAYNGFFGCKHFSLANKFLKENNRTEIDWQID